MPDGEFGDDGGDDDGDDGGDDAPDSSISSLGKVRMKGFDYSVLCPGG